MITQGQLEEMRVLVSHVSPEAMYKVKASDLAELLTELWLWRRGGVTEELLRINDGAIKIGRGCVVVSEKERSQ
jgi:hypothetical protein